MPPLSSRHIRVPPLPGSVAFAARRMRRDRVAVMAHGVCLLLSRLAPTRPRRHNPGMSDAPIQLSYDRGTVVVRRRAGRVQLPVAPRRAVRPADQHAPRPGPVLPRHRRTTHPREDARTTDPARGWPTEPTGWKLNAERTPRLPDWRRVEAWTEDAPRRRRHAHRHRQDLRRVPVHREGRPADARRHAEDRPDEAVVRANWNGRSASRSAWSAAATTTTSR